MATDWGMDFEGHVPTFGAALPEEDGPYVGKVADIEVIEYDPKQNPKGDKVRLTLQVTEGPHAGGTISQVLYILNGNFNGKDTHAAATKDNWFHLFRVTGTKAGKVKDMRKAARALVGKPLGFGVRKNGEYTNVGDLFPAAAISTTAGASEAEVDDTTDLTDLMGKDTEADTPDVDDDGADLSDIA